MHHTGTLYMSKARPETGTGDGGAFQLTLQLIDNLGTHAKQVYRVRWEGPEAAAFWQRHQADLQPGAILRAELQHLRVHVGATYPPLPELRARAKTLEICPKRLPAERGQLSNQEHGATA